MDSLTAMEQLKCPVCWEIPPAKIFQCKSGHTVCHRCRDTLEHCPVCRASYGEEKIRTLQIELILDKTKFPCLHKAEGCEEMLERKNVLQHRKSCKFGVPTFNLCKLMGYKCHFETKENQIDSFILHLQTRHEAQTLDSLDIEFMQNFPQTTKKKRGTSFTNSVWNPIIFGTQTKHLLLSHLNGPNKTVTWTCLTLDEVDNEEECSVSFSIRSVKSDESDLKWKQPYGKYTQAEKMLTGRVFQVPISFLEEHYSTNNSMGLSVSISTSQLKEANDSVHSGTGPEQIQVVTNPFECEEEVRPVPSFGGDENHSWSDWTCIICAKVGFKGNVFICLQCANIPFCQDCFSPSIHAQHIFALIRSEEQADALYEMSGGPSNALFPHITPDEELHDWVKGSNTAVFAKVMCDSCETIPIVGTRYKCLQCENFDLCHSCASSGIHSQHTFGVVTNLHQQKVIRRLASQRSPLLQRTLSEVSSSSDYP